MIPPPTDPGAGRGWPVLVGGVGQLYQGDLDLGRLAAERLSGEDLGPDVRVEDLYYGALAVSQLLEDLRPTSLVLVGAEQRGREAGTVERRRVRVHDLAPSDLQRSMESAGTGYVTIDLVTEVAGALGVLPDRTIAVEVEPERAGPATELSPTAANALDEALGLVRTEVRRLPVLELSDEVRKRLDDDRGLEPSPSLEAVRRLLDELRRLDEEGRWGTTFSLRDQLRLDIAEGRTSEGMEHLDWGLWWTLIEELDRLEALEAVR